MSDFFDRLIDEIVHSAPAPSSHATLTPVVAGMRRVRFTRPRPGRRLLVGVALLCLPGTLGGLALAGTFGGQRISPQQWVDGQRVQPEVAVTSAQSAHLGILRRPRVASDALLPADAFSVTHTPMAANGVNPSLSRRVEGFASGAAWVIPGNGMVCLMASNAQGLAMVSERLPPGSAMPRRIARVPGANGAAGCATDSNASKGWSAGTGGTSESPGMIFTAGIVPDGVSSVTVRLASGGSLSLPVHENIYMAEIHGWPSSVSFTGPTGIVTIGNGPDVLAHHARSAASRQAVTAASVASPVSVAKRSERVPVGLHNTKLETMLIVSFRARAPVTSGSSEYRVLMSCGADTIGGAVTSGVRPGQLVHHASPVGNCRGTLHATVLYTHGGHPNGGAVANHRRGQTLTVGTRAITIR